MTPQFDNQGQNDGTIVGAGSVALLTGGWLSSVLQKITFYESTKLIGGVTREISRAFGDRFFAGCHYLESKYLPPGFDYSSLKSFEHTYSSLTDVGSGFVLKSNFAGPSFPESWFDFEDPTQESDQDRIAQLHPAGERLRAYPDSIYGYMIRFLKRFFPNEDYFPLSSSSLSAVGLGRVTTQGDEEWLVRRKKDQRLFDEIYGVPRSALGLTPELALIPEFGFSNFWENFLEQLRDHVEIDIRFGSKVNRPNIFEEITSAPDRLRVWTADPRFPVRNYSGSRLASLSFTKYLTGVLVSSFAGPALPHYVNIFETRAGITRLYFYQLDSEIKMTIESLAPFQDFKQLETDLSELLEAAEIELTIPSQELVTVPTRQYFPMLDSDQKLIRKTSGIMESNGWLAPGLDTFDRSGRMMSLIENLASTDLWGDKNFNFK